MLACYEELAGLLWEQGRLPAAIELAEAWNRLAGLHELAVVSGYPAGLQRSAVASLWARHTWVLEAPGLREPDPDGAARQPGADTAPAGGGSGSAGGAAGREESSGGHRDSPEEEKGEAPDRLARRLERKTATLERVQQANQELVEELRGAHTRLRELKGDNRQLRAANKQLREQVTEADEAGPADGLGPAAG